MRPAVLWALFGSGQSGGIWQPRLFAVREVLPGVVRVDQIPIGQAAFHGQRRFATMANVWDVPHTYPEKISDQEAPRERVDKQT